jgi:single-strand selective monofunctional uracil DNA glycosylase
LIGVGGFAEKQAKVAIEDSSLSPHPQIGKILHPSPASPAANKDWAGMVTAQLKDSGVW